MDCKKFGNKNVHRNGVPQKNGRVDMKWRIKVKWFFALFYPFNSILT